MKTKTNFHEAFQQTEIEPSSPRSFGLVFTAASLLFGMAPVRHGAPPRIWVLALAALLFLLSIFLPRYLAAPARLWFQLGILLSRIVNPVVMSLLFFCVITPLGLIMRMTGRDPLRLRMETEAKSYWLSRQPPGPDPASMVNQF